MDLREYFEASLSLNPGDKILIPCETVKEAESKRVQLSNIRRRFARFNAKVFYEIGVSRHEIEGKWHVILEKRAQVSDAIIVRASGQVEQFVVPETETTELTRIITLMLQDNLDESEILSLLSDRFSGEEIQETIEKLKK